MYQKARRILIFSTAYKPFVGGSELAIYHLTRQLPEIFFDLVTPRYHSALPREERENNVRILRLGWGTPLDKFLFPLLGFIRGFWLIKRRPYLAMHAFQASHAAGSAWLLKHIFPKLKFIVSLQEGEALDQQNFLTKFFRKLILRKADIITGISSYLTGYAKILNYKAKIELLPNGVDWQRFQTPAAQGSMLKQTLGIKEEERVIITVSRLVPKNGLQDLLAALVIVKAQLPEVKLLIAGAGPLRSDLQQQASALELASTVIFLGEVPHRSLPEYLKIADLFVRPSHSEGLGNAFLEAMAAGLPIVGTAVGGIPDFLIDGETGLFCLPRNPADLAEKLLRVIYDKKLRADIITNGRALVASRYDWKSIADQLNIIYGT